jgi:hypothetical protein
MCKFSTVEQELSCFLRHDPSREGRSEAIRSRATTASRERSILVFAQITKRGGRPELTGPATPEQAGRTGERFCSRTPHPNLLLASEEKGPDGASETKGSEQQFEPSTPGARASVCL